MFDTVYPYRWIMNEKGGRSLVRLFRFRTRQSRTIIVRTEQFHQHPLVVVKFYDKAHSNSDHRFTELTGGGGFGAIVRTCFQIMLDMAAQNPYLSFAFMGAPKPKEIQSGGNAMTHRYRLYDIVADSLFTNIEYEHRLADHCSLYLILCRQYCEQNSGSIEEITEMLRKAFPDEAAQL